MKSYFTYTNDQQQGPFSVQELKDMGITPGTPIWKVGFETWKKAGEIPELRSCFEAIPPPYNPSAIHIAPTYTEPVQKSSSAERVGRKFGKLLGWAGLIILISIVAGFIYNNTNTRSSSLLTLPVIDPEKSNPESYLRTDGTYNKNFWGDKITIKGLVTNNASHTNYKDVKIRVKYYSKTKSIIKWQDCILYDFFPYGMTKNFELKLYIPANMDGCGWEAVEATAY